MISANINKASRWKMFCIFLEFQLPLRVKRVKMTQTMLGTTLTRKGTGHVLLGSSEDGGGEGISTVLVCTLTPESAL